MHIILILVKEDRELDVASLLGHLVITDGSRAIKVKNTYIDSWFDALIRGLQSIRLDSSSVIALVDEPTPLVFEKEGSEIRMSYGDVVLDAGTIDSFSKDVQCAANLFLDIVRTEIGDVTNEILDGIDRFASNG